MGARQPHQQGVRNHQLKQAITTTRARCEAGIENVCVWVRSGPSDGSNGTYPDRINLIDAGWFARNDCAKGDLMGCYITEQAYANLEPSALPARSVSAKAQLRTADLYALALWFPPGPIHAAADAVLSACGT